ncbi:MAG: leader peptidase (prepilin peptidase) / N-methyltransferase [Actinomycetota bacterium]|nr:leader peptidase (prepilin peptidase) / N-methyltransferase [Actinomycetota bacterium]
MTGLIAAGCAFLGLLVGSFLNVVIWRVPRKESVVAPASHCPECEAPISPRDNIPVLSWLVLRGRCRHCGVQISSRYPLIELACAALFGAIGARFAHSWALPAYLVFGAGLLAISVIDLEHYIIPNRIVYPLGFASVPLLALAAGLEGEWWWFARALIGAVCAFSALFVIHVASPRGMGYGDVRLSFLIGLYLGYLGALDVPVGLFLGFAYGAVIGVLLMASGLRTRKQHVPFGPFLAAGAMTMILVGGPILDWYRSFGR